MDQESSVADLVSERDLALALELAMDQESSVADLVSERDLALALELAMA